MRIFFITDQRYSQQMLYLHFGYDHAGMTQSFFLTQLNFTSSDKKKGIQHQLFLLVMCHVQQT